MIRRIPRRKTESESSNDVKDYDIIEDLPEEVEEPEIRKYNTDPTDIDDGATIDRVVSVCRHCFGRIFQPILKGIWYHKDWIYLEHKDHIPEPASDVFLLYMYNHNSNESNKLKSYEDSKFHQCKKHQEYWNKMLGFKPMKKGWHNNHFFTEDYRSLCGIYIDLTVREAYRISKPKIPFSVYNICQKCRKTYESKIGKLKLSK